MYVLCLDISMFLSATKVILVVQSLFTVHFSKTAQNDVSHDSIKLGLRYLHLNMNIQLRTS